MTTSFPCSTAHAFRDTAMFEHGDGKERRRTLGDVRMILALWDVDGTLISNGGVSKDTYRGAFELLTGVSAVHTPRTAGGTDVPIMHDLAAMHSVTLTAETEDIRNALEQSLAARRTELAARGRSLPGAHDGITALAAMDGVVQSVLTGNIRPNGFAKLDTFGLAGPPLDWDIGAFGSDDSVRSNLVSIAQKRARVKYGTEFTPNDTVLIGDTPNDVRAGREGGAKVIGVATGKDDVDTLVRAGADAVLPDLADTAAFLSAFKQVLA
ncbi:HAD family hydrolase [Nocardia asteroides]|uniref:HAD family hydrolase n=1 Tax=Nocardia asteroides TaxID=1824 RepID=UPI001E4F67DC|nr:HAD hydrolase-like protein [Nocardia asteroides]UGT63595.1 haloacid dehalogenase-like hydrolase [Nocardia asteroides]